MQGESDGFEKSTAEAYGHNFAEFVKVGVYEAVCWGIAKLGLHYRLIAHGKRLWLMLGLVCRHAGKPLQPFQYLYL